MVFPRTTDNYSLQRCHLNSGFTLVEIMVVLVIIGLVVGAAAVNFTDSPQRQLAREVKRMQRVMNAVTEMAVIEGRDYGLAINEKQYQFVVFDGQEKQWLAVEEKFLKPFQWADPFTVQLSVEGEQARLFSKTANSRFSLDRATAIPQPQILLLANGEMTPFSIAFSHRDLPGVQVSLVTDGLSAVEVHRSGG